MFASSAMDASTRTSEGAARTSSAVDTAGTPVKVLTRSLPVLYLRYSTVQHYSRCCIFFTLNNGFIFDIIRVRFLFGVSGKGVFTITQKRQHIFLC